MASTLSQFEVRVSAYLFDATNAIFTLATIDEALRQALHEYTLAMPLAMETVITLPGTGREVALDGIPGLAHVTSVWWPFDSLTEVWPPNRVKGFRVWWDDARPVLFLSMRDGLQPKVNDQMRVWYTKAHTISGLDAAAITSVLLPEHETLLVIGACAHSCLSRSLHLAEDITQQGIATPDYAALAQRLFRRFRAGLVNVDGLAHAPDFVSAEAFGTMHSMDKWDRRGEGW